MHGFFGLMVKPQERGYILHFGSLLKKSSLLAKKLISFFSYTIYKTKKIDTVNIHCTDLIFEPGNRKEN
jgi:hypothetical protein